MGLVAGVPRKEKETGALLAAELADLIEKHDRGGPSAKLSYPNTRGYPRAHTRDGQITAPSCVRILGDSKKLPDLASQIQRLCSTAAGASMFAERVAVPVLFEGEAADCRWPGRGILRWAREW